MANRIEKKTTNFKGSKDVKLSNTSPSFSFKRPSAGSPVADPIDAPAKSMKNLTKFKKTRSVEY